MIYYADRFFQTVGAALMLVGIVALGTTSVARASGLAGGVGHYPPPSFYISFPDASDVGVVDPSTGEIEAVIPVRGEPIEMVVNPARPIVYFVLGDQQIVAYQTVDQRRLGSVTIPATCSSYAINASGSKIYASSCGGQNVYLANTKTFTLTGSIQFPSIVSGIAISDRRRRLYAALTKLHSVAIVNVESGQIELIKYLGQCGENACSPDEVVVSPDDRYLISQDQKDCVTIDYDLDTGRVVGRVPDHAGRRCQILGVDVFSNELWVEGGDRGGNYAGVSMAPPFNQIASSGGARLETAAFSPSGQGFAVGSARNVRYPNYLVSFPAPTLITTLWSDPFKIVYVP